jgi:hypothetical protein
VKYVAGELPTKTGGVPALSDPVIAAGDLAAESLVDYADGLTDER